MRSLLITAALFVSTALSTVTSGASFQVKQTIENGKVQFIGKGLEGRAARNVVIVATANKLARISWAVLSSGENYHPMPVLAVAS